MHVQKVFRHPVFASDVDIARYAPDTLYSLWTPTSYALQLLLLKRVMGRRRGGHPRQRPTRAGRSREGGASAAAAAPGASSQPAVHGQPLSAGGNTRVRGHVQDTSRARPGHVHGRRGQLAVRRRRQSDSSSDSSSAYKKEKNRRKKEMAAASVRLLLEIVVRLLEPRNEGGRRLAHLRYGEIWGDMGRYGVAASRTWARLSHINSFTGCFSPSSREKEYGARPSR